jgi:hypothetical protein
VNVLEYAETYDGRRYVHAQGALDRPTPAVVDTHRDLLLLVDLKVLLAEHLVEQLVHLL